MRIHRQILRNAAALLAGGLLVVASVRADGPQAHGDRDEIRAQADLVLVQKIHGPERGYGKLLIESREFGDLVFEADLRSLPGVSHYGLVFRYRDQRHFYRLVLRPTNEDFRVEKVIEPKIERKELGEDFVEHYTYRAVTSLGRTHDLLDFPGIMKLRSGELLSIFIEELQHGTPPWATQPASGKLWMTRSSDLGRSWSPPTPFLDTPLDDRHGYTLQLSSGDLLSFWWVQSVAFGVPGVFNFASRSSDGGATWEDPLRVRSGKPARPDKLGVPGGFSLTVPPSELPDGTLVMPVHCLSSVDRALPEIGLLRSRDGGRTWGDYSTIAYDPEDRISFVEPAVVRLRSGKWIAVTRTEVPIHPDRTHPYTLGPTMTCTSTDEGRTWSEPDRLPLGFTWQGSTAPFLMQTDSGVVVFAVNTGIAFSYDDGKTWEPQAVNCGYYPNLLEIAPNTIAALAAGMQGRVFSLTRPTGGVPPPDGAVTPPEVERDKPQHGQVDSSPWKPRGMFRAVRVRKARDRRLSPLLAQPNWPLLAVARTTTDDGEAIMGVIRGVEGQWSSPRLVAKASAAGGDPVLAQAADGTLLCAFPGGLD
ncbi:MAG: exo-alpha-sialidase, partial [Planctomycetes bacterium]|nr:exo-alpha-sialidase [Planctomycetota bacterium]